MSTSEIQHCADFSAIRYAQCWEDSRLLTAALKPAGRHCLSIGSAGDNSFALLAAGAASVTAVEMNAALRGIRWRGGEGLAGWSG